MKKYYLSAILSATILSSLIAQNGELSNLDIDYGVAPVRLESSFQTINSIIKLDEFICAHCNTMDSVSQKHKVTVPKEIMIGGIYMNRPCYMHFFDDSLYKIDITFHYDSDNERHAVLNYFLSKYGKETKQDGIAKIWETPQTYLSVSLREYVSYNTTNDGYIKIISKRLRNACTEQIDALIIRKKSLVDRLGKGNETFIPDVNSSIKLLLANTTIASIEKSFPTFSHPEPDTLYSYSEITNKFNLLNSIRYTYTLTYKNLNQVSVKVDVNKNKIIKRIEYEFFIDPGIRFAFQRNQNGLIINERMTKIVTKMGFNNCTVYDNNNIHLTEYTSRHFTVEKY